MSFSVRLNSRTLDGGKLLPYAQFPTGWFQVAWSHEVPTGSVVPLRYFAQDLVCYRGASGSVAVFDAYCRHLGANLAVGGKVIDDNLKCPFHGWEYDLTGQNVKIPYSRIGCNPRVRLKSWPVRELNGIIYIWHAADGSSPSWEPPNVQEFEDENFYDLASSGVMKLWQAVPFQPQHVLENSADFAHLKYVHKNAEVATVERHEADGIRFIFTFGTTYLTPDAGAVPGSIPGEWWGMGILLFKLFGVHDTVEIVTVTPIDHGTSDVRISVTARREEGQPAPVGMAQRIMLHQVKEIDRDIPIWTNMRYLDRPTLAPEETRGFKLLRNWAEQFYPSDDGAVEALVATPQAVLPPQSDDSPQALPT